MIRMLELFPQDTRIVELVSGVAMTFVGFAMLVSGSGITEQLQDLGARHFWVLLTIIFGTLQVAAIITYRRAEHLRFILAWAAGSFWLWLSMEHLTAGFSPTEVVTFLVGISNLYAFVINLLLVKQSWKC